MHSLVEGLWDEWGACSVEGVPLLEAECAGLLTGLLPMRGDPLALGTSRLWIARRLLRLWRRTSWFDEWNIAEDLSIPTERHGGKVRIRIPDAFRERLLAMAADLAAAPSLAEEHWAWLRGLWGNCGGLYLPRAGYYLVLRVALPATAEALGKMLDRTRIPWKTRIFRGASEMILRDQESIVTFLCNLGLSAVSLRLEDKAIVRSMRDQANRVSNCDTANIRRALRVAEEQTRLAQEIVREGLLHDLPPVMRSLVEARLDNPEASLAELGEKLSPTLTKSTVKYHWNRLQDYVTSLPPKRGTRGVEDELNNRE